MSYVLKVLAGCTFLEPYTSGHDESGNRLNLYTEQDLLRACEIYAKSFATEIRNRTIMECAEFLEVGNYDVVTENYCFHTYDNANETISEIRTAILALKGDEK